MITLGLPLYIGAHTVTQGLATASMSAATWASPLAYLDAVLTELSEAATLSGVKPDKLRMDTPFSPDPLTWANDTTGNLAAAYVGADSLSLAFSADSEPTVYLWTGDAEKRPGLLPKYSTHARTSRSGHHGTGGVLLEDSIGLWTSTGALSDLEAWYAFAQTMLAGYGAIEVRDGTTTTIWYLDLTDIAVDPRSSDGTYTACTLPLVRGA